MANLAKTLRRAAARLDRSKPKPTAAAFLFFGTIGLRAALEGILSYSHLPSPLSVLMEYPLFYGGVFLWVCFWVSLFARERPETTAATFVRFFPIILLPPLVDGIFAPELAGTLNYVQVASWGDWLASFLTYFGIPLGVRGATPGIAVEVGLVMVGVGVYVGLRGRGVLAALLAAAATYAVVFCLGTTPFIRSALNSALFAEGDGSPAALSRDAALVLALLAGGIAFAARQRLFRRLFAERIRVVAVAVALASGFAAGVAPYVPKAWGYIIPFDVVLVFAAFILAAPLVDALFAADPASRAAAAFAAILAAEAVAVADLFFMPMLIALLGAAAAERMWSAKLWRAFWQSLALFPPAFAGFLLARRGPEEFPAAYALFFGAYFAAGYADLRRGGALWRTTVLAAAAAHAAYLILR